MIYAKKHMLCKFLVNHSTFAFTYVHFAHYVFDETSGTNRAFATS